MIALPPAFAGGRLFPLRGGLCNHSYRLRLKGRDYFLRLAGAESDGLGIDRQQELEALRLAAAAGLAPPLMHAEPGRGLLIQAWIPEPVWTPARARSPDGLRCLARLAARLHRLTPPAGHLDLAARLSAYLGALSAPAPEWIARCRQLQARLAALAPQAPVFCHNDLHAGNLLGRRPWLLDWEYAACGDAAFELAGICLSGRLDAQRAAQLLAAYRAAGGECSPERVRQMLPVADFMTRLWTRLLAERRASRLAGARQAQAGLL